MIARSYGPTKPTASQTSLSEKMLALHEPGVNAVLTLDTYTVLVYS